MDLVSRIKSDPYGRGGMSRVKTREEELSEDKARALRDIPVISLMALASIVCKMSLDTVLSLREGKRAKIRPMDSKKEDKRVMRLCDKIEKGVYSYYDAVAAHLSSRQSRSTEDVYESMALSTEEAERVAMPYLNDINGIMDTEFAQCRPIDRPLFLQMVRLLFVSSIFINYRHSFVDELRMYGVTMFRKMCLDDDLRALANELKMRDREGKTLRFLYTGLDVSLWDSLKGRRSYKGIDVASQHLVDIRECYASEAIDRKSYDFVKAMFGFENIDRICAAGNGGVSYGYKEKFTTSTFFGCMATYEQYSITVDIMNGNLRKAQRNIERLKERYDASHMLVAYDTLNGRTRFHGIWTSEEEALYECNIPRSTLETILGHNAILDRGRMQCKSDIYGRAYFRLSVFEEMLDRILQVA